MNDDTTAHYFDERPDVPSEERVVEVLLPDVSFRLVTDAGVFSHGRLDRGTALLLHTAPAPPATGDLLDLGCGAGPIAITMALRSPEATVWAVDVNARARALCERNAAAAGAMNIRVCHPDEVDAAVRFATIWSNPPIRIGKAALHGLLHRWLGRLTPDGAAILVVQKHLGADSLAAWLTTKGFPTERLASRAGFRILRSGSPRRP
jgi:16S rRNA (guanine1207-N2)-methyltransferase